MINMEYRLAKHILLLCGILFIVFLSMSDYSLAESTGIINGLSWSLSDEGVLEISGNGRIPAFPQGAWRDHLEEIQEIVIDNGVTIVGTSAFNGCSNVISVSLPDSISAIEGWAFKDCSSMTEINIPAGVKTIDLWAFQQCSSLQEIIIPDSLTYIGHDAFFMCSAIRYANFDSDGARAISKAGYSFRVNNDNYSLQYQFSNDTVIGLGIFDVDKDVTSFTIPSFITHIGNYAFNECSSLEQVIIPDGVLSIGEYAFFNCNKLSKLIIPDSVISIGIRAFNNCRNLKTIKLPSRITALEGYILAGCSSLSSITIPNQVTSIGDSAFSGCSSLTSVVIPDGVSYVGGGAFYCCTNLVTVTIPDSVEILGAWAFINCYNLKSISIPKNVTEIREKAFYWCHNLSKVAFFQPENKEVHFGENIFSNRPTIYCYEYSDPDSWAIDCSYDIVNFEQLSDTSSIRVLTMPESIRIPKGTLSSIDLNVFPDDNPQITWSSSNPEIVTVDEGIITAIDIGEARITATIGTVSEDVVVTVYVQAESYDLNESEVWLIAKESINLSAVNILPIGAEATFNWSSSNTNLATVNQDGVVTTKKPGTVIISAISDNGIRKDCTLHLCYRVSSIVFSENTYVTNRSTPIFVSAEVTMNTQSCINQLVSFSSEDANIATIDERTGFVTPVGVGRTTITAIAKSDETIIASCIIIVKGTILQLPANLTRIESEAFATVDSIDGIEVPSCISYIAEDAFGERDHFTIIGTISSISLYA